MRDCDVEKSYNLGSCRHLDRLVYFIKGMQNIIQYNNEVRACTLPHYRPITDNFFETLQIF